MPYMQAFLKKQGIDFELTVVEQTDGKHFNRGKLLNIGFDLTAASKKENSYFCFHDVDLLPENNCDYTLPEQPVRLVTELIYPSGHANKIYPGSAGGVVLFKPDDFITINGFSNNYWGWGAEDDDLARRLRFYGIKLARRAGTYQDIEANKSDQFIDADKKRALNPHYSANKNRVWNTNYDYQKDGLNNLSYQVIQARNCATHKRYVVAL